MLYAFIAAGEAANSTFAPVGALKWYTLEGAYNLGNIARFPTLDYMLPIRRLYLAGGLFLYLIRGCKPKEWPSDYGVVLLLCIRSMSKGGSATPILKNNAPLKYDSKLVDGDVYNRIVINLTSQCSKIEELPDTTSIETIILKVAEGLLANTHVEYQGLCDFLTIVQQLDLLDNVWSYYMYYLRLATKTTEDVERHHAAKNDIVLGWCELNDIPHLASPEKKYWGELSQKLKPLRGVLASMLCDLLLNDTAAYDIAKKWFASRYEFYGMSLIQALVQLQAHVPIKYLIMSLITSHTEVIYGYLFASYLVYACGTWELRVNSDRILLPTFTNEDAITSRFARLFSSNYCNWATFFGNAEITGNLAGALSVLKPDVPVPENYKSTLAYETGATITKIVTTVLMAMNGNLNPVARHAASLMTRAMLQGPTPRAAIKQAPTTSTQSTLADLASGL